MSILNFVENDAFLRRPVRVSAETAPSAELAARPATRPRPRRAVRLAGVALLLVFAAQTLFAMRRNSVTVDEICYITAGYSYWRTGDFTFNTTNPPLPRMLAAAPLLLVNPELPPRPAPSDNGTIIDEWKYAREFLFHNRIDADRMLFIARVPIVALGVLLGAYVWRWGTELFGAAAGLLALFAYAFSPDMIANAGLATQDLAFAAFAFMAAYYFWRYWTRPATTALLMSGICCGLALLSKTSAVFLAPTFALYALASIVRGSAGGVDERWPWVRWIGANRSRWRQLITAMTAAAVIVLVVLAMLHVGYGFADVAAKEAGTARSVADKLPLPRAVGRTFAWTLPAPFMEMMLKQGRLIQDAGPTYFAGAVHRGGVWYQMAASVLLKTPLPTLLLFAIGAALFVGGKLKGAGLPLALIVVLLGMFSVLSRISIGLRYVLPIYPALFVVAGGILAGRWAKARWAQVSSAAACSWLAVSVAGIYPHHLAYFNELAGGPRHGYRWLVDANLDWGQDLRALKGWMAQHAIDKLALSYFGSADADYYGINYDYLPSVGLAPREPQDKWWYEEGAGCRSSLDLSGHDTVAVSATMLMAPGWLAEDFRPCFAALRDREPDDMVGYSILIYHLGGKGDARRTEAAQ